MTKTGKQKAKVEKCSRECHESAVMLFSKLKWPGCRILLDLLCCGSCVVAHCSNAKCCVTLSDFYIEISTVDLGHTANMIMMSLNFQFYSCVIPK